MKEPFKKAFTEKGKRGISPIIASILLIVFILVISVLVMNWMRKSVEKQIESGEERSEETVTGLKTGIKILGARVKSGIIDVTLTNTGKNTVNGFNVNIKGSKGNKVEKRTVDIQSLDSATESIGYNPNEIGDIEKIEITPIINDKLIGISKTSKTISSSVEGSGSYNIGLSCKDIYDNYGGTESRTYFVDPDGEGGNNPFEVYCDMTSDGGGWSMVWKNFGGPRYSSYSNQISNLNLWGSSKSNIVTPFSYSGEIASHKNVEAWNVFISKKDAEWIKLVRSYNSNENLYEDNRYTYVVKLDLGDGVAMNDVMTTINCKQLSNQVEMFTDSVSYGKTDRTISSSGSMGFANSVDHCNLPPDNLMDGWNARHVISYGHTSTGRDTVRCQFECWGEGSPNVITETIWGVREK